MANVIDESSPQFGTAPQKSGSKGCLYGCLAVIVGGVLLVVCAGVGGWWFVKGQIEKFTSTEPQPIPTVEFNEEQMAELQTRVDTFTAAIEGTEQPQEDLVLTADDINALINSSEQWKGKLYVTIENDEVSGDVSIPLDGVPGASGRYFNGSASLSVKMQNGKLFVSLVDAEVNGEPVPQEIVDSLAAENLAKDAYKDPETKKVLDRLEDIRTVGDKLILKLKREETSEDVTETPPADESATESSDGEQAPTTGDGDAEEPSESGEAIESSEQAETELQPADPS